MAAWSRKTRTQYHRERAETALLLPPEVKSSVANNELVLYEGFAGPILANKTVHQIRLSRNGCFPRLTSVRDYQRQRDTPPVPPPAGPAPVRKVRHSISPIPKPARDRARKTERIRNPLQQTSL